MLQVRSASAVQRIGVGAESGGSAGAGVAPVANQTGMPDQLKAGIEALSSLDMSGVQVHRNSNKPAQLNALAYAHGSDIHLGPGQEQHLPHEAWHVVQQAQGRVRPTMQMAGGVAVNDDEGLEREADVMGARAMQGVGGGGKRQDLIPNMPPNADESHRADISNVRGSVPPSKYRKYSCGKVFQAALCTPITTYRRAALCELIRLMRHHQSIDRGGPARTRP